MNDTNDDRSESEWLLFDSPRDVSAELVNVQSLSLTTELLRELKPGHELFGCQFKIVGRRWSQDDILVVVDEHDGFASVHLTYAADEVPPYPRTAWYPSIEAAVEAMSD